MKDNLPQTRTWSTAFWNRFLLTFIWPLIIAVFAFFVILIIPFIGMFGSDDTVENTLNGGGKKKKEE